MFSIQTREDVDQVVIWATAACVLLFVATAAVDLLYASQMDFGSTRWTLAGLELGVYAGMTYGIYSRIRWVMRAAPFVYGGLVVATGVVSGASLLQSVLSLGILGALVLVLLGRAAYVAWKYPGKL